MCFPTKFCERFVFLKFRDPPAIREPMLRPHGIDRSSARPGEKKAFRTETE
jgi:hypothetical protein